MPVSKKMKTFRSDLFNIAIGFCIALVLAFNFVPTVHAQSSLNSLAQCAKSPSCSASLGIKESIRSGSAANNIVPFGISGGSGAAVSGSASTASLSKPLVTAGAGGLAVWGMTSSQRDSLRERGIESLSNGVIPGELRIERTTQSMSTVVQYISNVVSYTPSIQTQITTSGIPIFTMTYTKSDGQVKSPSPSAHYPHDLTWQGRQKNWDELTEDEKDDAVNNLTDDDYDELLDAPPQYDYEPTPDTPFVDFTPGEDVVYDNGEDFEQIPAGDTKAIPNDNYTGPDSDGDGIPDSEDTDDDNDGIPDSQDPDADGNGIDDNAEQPNEIEVPTVEKIEPKQFDAPNFLEHAVTVFSAKFPFDVMGEFDPVTSNECPIYSFFGDSYELCPVKDAVSIMRIPAVIAIIIWAVVAL